jgi:hypothetical protein
MGSIRRNLQAQPKIIKKLSKYKINQSKQKKFKKKVFLVPQKGKGAKNLYESYPTEFTGSTQNPKKNIRTNQLIRTKIFQKKVCLVPYKEKEPKICMGFCNVDPKS